MWSMHIAYTLLIYTNGTRRLNFSRLVASSTRNLNPSDSLEMMEEVVDGDDGLVVVVSGDDNIDCLARCSLRFRSVLCRRVYLVEGTASSTRLHRVFLSF